MRTCREIKCNILIAGSGVTLELGVWTWESGNQRFWSEPASRQAVLRAMWTWISSFSSSSCNESLWTSPLMNSCSASRSLSLLSRSAGGSHMTSGDTMQPYCAYLHINWCMYASLHQALPFQEELKWGLEY